MLNCEVVICAHKRTNMSENRDVELIQRISARDQAVLSELYQRYIDMVYDLAYYILRSAELAEEVSQDTFLKVWNQAHAWDPQRGGLSTWLLTITRYTAIDRLRMENRRASWGAVDLDDVIEFLANGGSSGEEAWQNRQLIDSMMRELSPDQFQVIELAFYQGMTHTEIAEKLSLPLGTVKGRLRSALQKLRDLYGSSK